MIPLPTRRRLTLVLLAVLFTLLNSLKPLHVDDAAYYYYAAQIAQHPLDPYGFEIHWYQHPLPANHVLAPPVLPYWWAAALRLFGDQPFLWKLWLFPISLLFVFSLHALFRRFAPDLEMPLVTMTVLSPTFLPSLNLMLDVPALALGLAALTLFFLAWDRLNIFLAIAAGLVAGLAMETKYTAFLVPATMLLYSLVAGFLKLGFSGTAVWQRIALGLVAGIVAGAVFVVWESYIAWKYGVSHFVHEYQNSNRNLLDQFRFALPLLALLGGVASPLALFALIALGRRFGVLTLAGLVMIAGYALVVCVGATVQLKVTDVLFPIPDDWWIFSWSLEDVIFTVLGLLVAGPLLVVAARLLWRPGNWFSDPDDWFVVLWLGLEVAGYFVLTPFAAVRRIMGVVVVGTLLAGRLASRTCCSPERRRQVRWVAFATIFLGLVFYGVDLRDACASREAAEDAAAFIRSQDARATIWFVGHWGFQYYAEHAGMKAVVPDRSSSPLRQGDWLIVPDEQLEQQAIHVDSRYLERVEQLSIRDGLPLRTLRCFYGTLGAPLQHQHGPRVEVTIYRVTKDFVPVAPP
jgi:hypothetical protein